MEEIRAFFEQVVAEGASDMFFVAGLPRTYKVGKTIRRVGERLMPQDTAQLVEQLYAMAGGRSCKRLDETGEDDFALSIPGLSRFRINVYRQRGSLALVIRTIRFELPNPDAIHIPKTVMDLADLRRGMLLVTGPAGCGKSTTLACLIDRINRTREGHIITLEDPIEYLHRHDKSIVSQREIGLDTEGYVPALRASLRQAPDVILVGEMRDYETIRIALTAAETGHLVISTLHTTGAANTIDRIVDAFPQGQQGQVRVQLAMVLRAVVCQQLVPAVDGGVYPAFEVMKVNNAAATLIRDAKMHQMESVITASGAEGMQTMDADLMRLAREGIITAQEALHYSMNREQMARRLNLRG